MDHRGVLQSTQDRLPHRRAPSRIALGADDVVALLAPVAVRLLQIRAYARHADTAHAPARLDDVEIEALRAMPRAQLPRRPTNRDVMLAIARLGGFLKQNGEPGWIILGRGYASHPAFLEGWLAARDSITKTHRQRVGAKK